ncbi:MAG TPA: hypothetical protein VMU22_00360 [Rhizomicrobium sp.]|nr:hypothetical protein [Rhizomicrobium sp.]
MASNDREPSSRVGSRLREEIIRFAVIAGYLYVCFGALIVYKAAILRAHGVDFPILGLAVVKALVLGKFILVGRDLHLGERHRDRPLAYTIVYQVIMFAVLLFVLSVIEEMILAWVHGRAPAEGLSHVAGSTGLEILASCLLLCLILTPYFGLAALNERLGEGRLGRLFFGE